MTLLRLREKPRVVLVDSAWRFAPTASAGCGVGTSGWHDPQPFQHLGLSLPCPCRDVCCEQRGLRQQVSRRGHGRALQLPHGLHAPARQEDVQRWVGASGRASPRTPGCLRPPVSPHPLWAFGMRGSLCAPCPASSKHHVLLGDRHRASPHAPSDIPVLPPPHAEQPGSHTGVTLATPNLLPPGQGML